MKRMIKGFFLFLILFGCCVQTVAAAPVSVTLNGSPIPFDTAPYIENGRVMVPMRGILESLGYSVQWENETKTVLATKGEVAISLPLDSTTVTVNNTEVTIDTPARLNGTRTFVPLRFLAEYSGADVRWDNTTFTVIIETGVTENYQLEDSIVLLMTDKLQGSGIVLTADGLIATNYHVIQNCSTAQFIFNNGDVYQGKTTIIGLDPVKDIALLKIEKNDLSPAMISLEYEIGDPVFTIGAPGGNQNTISTGVIEGFDEDVICTTAVISGGSSGGGLFNADGHVIGMTSFHGEGMYFSIPLTHLIQTPQNLSAPIGEMKNFTYHCPAPQNLRHKIEDDYSYITWSPIGEAEYYHVYVSDTKYGTYKKMKNDVLKGYMWHWGFPYGLGIHTSSDDPYYLRISAVVNGKETPLSEPLIIE